MGWAKKQVGRQSWRSWGIVRRQRAIDQDFQDEGNAPSQRWFWTDRWQKMEREVDEHVARGEIETFDSSGAFLTSLNRVSVDPTASVLPEGDWLCRCHDFHAPHVEQCEHCGMRREESPGIKTP